MGHGPSVESSSSSSSTKESWWKETWKSTIKSAGWTTKSTSTSAPEDDIFVPIAKDNILSQIPIGRHHPVKKLGIEDSDTRTIQTNKFYANFFLGGQNQPVWTHPYVIWWTKGVAKVSAKEPDMTSWGIGIDQTDGDAVEFPPGEQTPVKYYSNPLYHDSLILSAQELGPETILTTDTLLPFSVNVNLLAKKDDLEPTLTIPCVQGMAFVTGGYRNATPLIQSGIKFRSMSKPIKVDKSVKYRVVTLDGKTWLIYVNPVPTAQYDATAFRVIDSQNFVGPPNFKGTIQIAKNPISDDGEAIYSKAVGSFVTEATLTGSANNGVGTYTISYTKIGKAPLLIFALPHHIQSLSPDLQSSITKLQLRTTTKGMATALFTENLTMLEPNLPTNMTFAPWAPGITSAKILYSPKAIEAITYTADRDIRIAISETPDSESFYYAGKSLAKLATLGWVVKDVLNNPTLVSLALTKLKEEFQVYVQNKQKYMLFYDDDWKGIVSSAGFTNSPGADFGNTYYNDHHFHWGYFVYTAAVIGYLDPDWLNQGDSRAWVNMLVKDFAESDKQGRDYPFSRSFDWWAGHSWAKGLLESADGKDEESSSEDGFASFAVKMWGRTSGNVMMEKRGNLMLAIQARSFSNYFYMLDNNTNAPPQFIGNKISGVFFDNKVDHTTYFGPDSYLISSIHILPISPATSYLRSKAFVREEWDRFFSDNRALQVPGGWRGILMANLAIIDAKTAWGFFKDGVMGSWDDRWIDGGASRTWYLVWCAGLGGAPR
ncbi:endo-1,3-beta-glucanase Engl1 [Lindgomyces ingoldianus]|uniref:Endo-1,3-beta-glucanase Engl1 n=1 Tax=Lindgomyces ingoldianus TaxID=673940 RepID=A0ACB6QNR3_9PLEO|nr:endo-1,3-beta-glucanase Engl1 [Lindgomyces ingoldianus]KAF2468624.1 endo-1,3-beta-glucanase Engl1 [Lindgomyces ingoldianus]